MVTSGIVAFFTAQPAMLDQVPQLGHIPKLFKAMSSRNDSIPKTALQIVQQLSNSEVGLSASRCTSALQDVAFFHNFPVTEVVRSVHALVINAVVIKVKP